MDTLRPQIFGYLLQYKDFLFQRLNCIGDTKIFVLMMEGFFIVPRRFVKRGSTVYTIKKNRMFLNFKLQGCSINYRDIFRETIVIEFFLISPSPNLYTYSTGGDYILPTSLLWYRFNATSRSLASVRIPLAST